jgi:hypothetical protein
VDLVVEDFLSEGWEVWVVFQGKMMMQDHKKQKKMINYMKFLE